MRTRGSRTRGAQTVKRTELLGSSWAPRPRVQGCDILMRLWVDRAPKQEAGPTHCVDSVRFAVHVSFAMSDAHRRFPAVTVRRAASGDAALLAALGARLFEQTFATENAPTNMREYVADAFSIDRQAEALEDADRAAWI